MRSLVREAASAWDAEYGAEPLVSEDGQTVHDMRGVMGNAAERLASVVRTARDVDVAQEAFREAGAWRVRDWLTGVVGPAVLSRSEAQAQHGHLKPQSQPQYFLKGF